MNTEYTTLQKNAGMIVEMELFFIMAYSEALYSVGYSKNWAPNWHAICMEECISEL